MRGEREVVYREPGDQHLDIGVICGALADVSVPDNGSTNERAAGSTDVEGPSTLTGEELVVGYPETIEPVIGVSRSPFHRGKSRRWSARTAQARARY